MLALILYLFYFTITDELKGYTVKEDGFFTRAQCEYVRHQMAMQQTGRKKYGECNEGAPVVRDKVKAVGPGLSI